VKTRSWTRIFAERLHYSVGASLFIINSYPSLDNFNDCSESELTMLSIRILGSQVLSATSADLGWRSGFSE
jgi:hypothetical protein